MKKEKLYRVAAWCVVLVSGGALGYLALAYLSGILLPFLAAFGVALLLRPIVLYLCRKSRFSQPIIGILLFFILVFILLYVLIALAVYLSQEAGAALSALLAELNREENFIQRFFASVEQWQERFPFLQGPLFSEGATLYDGIVRVAKNMLSELSAGLTAGVTRALSALPRGIFAVSVSLIAMFYFFKDYPKIVAVLMERIPERGKAWVRAVKHRLLEGMVRYLRAYLLLMFLTFAELLVGFLVLGINYAVLIALVTAILDLLPVIGVGIVLIPWAIFSFVVGETTLGIGLLILYLILYLVRQIIEPKLVSGVIGVHPLLTLFAVYAGYRLFGVAGMILGPLLAFLGKAFFVRDVAEERSNE